MTGFKVEGQVDNDNVSFLLQDNDMDSIFESVLTREIQKYSLENSSQTDPNVESTPPVILHELMTCRCSSKGSILKNKHFSQLAVTVKVLNLASQLYFVKIKRRQHEIPINSISSTRSILKSPDLPKSIIMMKEQDRKTPFKRVSFSSF